MNMSGQLHGTTAVSPGTESRYPSKKKLGRLKSQFGLFGLDFLGKDRMLDRLASNLHTLPKSYSDLF